MSYLVTGGLGCIGAWTLYHLVKRGEKGVCFDIGEDRQRLDKLLTADEQKKIAYETPLEQAVAETITRFRKVDDNGVP